MSCVSPQTVAIPSTLESFVYLFNTQLLQNRFGEVSYLLTVPYQSTPELRQGLVNWYTDCGWTTVICNDDNGSTNIFLERP
jgi:hypothetical protein